MLKGRIFRICFLILMLIFCLHLTSPMQAEEKDCNGIKISTSPGDAGYENMEPLQFDPGNDDEIQCGTPITIAVIGGLPPLDWGVPAGSGYSLTKIDERTYTLSCSGST